MDGFPTHAEFIASMLRQRFSLPDSIIYYITMNPKSPSFYQKLIQICKHFFTKNPILVFHCLEIHGDGGLRHCNGDCWTFQCDVDGEFNVIENGINSVAKLWISNEIIVQTISSDTASNSTDKIFQCDATKLQILNQRISFENWLKYSSNVKDCFMKNTVIFSGDYELEIEDIVAHLPNIQQLNYQYGPSKSAGVDTAKKLIEIQKFRDLTELCLFGLDEKFDIGIIYDHYKRNIGKFCMDMRYKESLVLPFGYQQKLDEITEYIINTNGIDFLPSNIEYYGMDPELRGQMFDSLQRYRQHNPEWDG